VTASVGVRSIFPAVIDTEAMDLTRKIRRLLMTLANQVMIMHDGRVVEVVSPQRPVGLPRHVVTRQLARARPFLSCAAIDAHLMTAEPP
jgi:ABC-type antimicrobial peptide transport system ATPase subunit